MKLEKKIINKVLHYRWYDDEGFKPYTLEELTAIIESKEKERSEIQDSLFEIYEGAYRAGQLNPNIQDNTLDDSPENEDVLDKLYELASKLNGELK